MNNKSGPEKSTRKFNSVVASAQRCNSFILLRSQSNFVIKNPPRSSTSRKMAPRVFGSTLEPNPKAQKVVAELAHSSLPQLPGGFGPHLVRIPNKECVLLDNTTINNNETSWLFNFRNSIRQSSSQAVLDLSPRWSQIFSNNTAKAKGNSSRQY